MIELKLSWPLRWDWGYVRLPPCKIVKIWIGTFLAVWSYCDGHFNAKNDRFLILCTTLEGHVLRSSPSTCLYQLDLYPDLFVLKSSTLIKRPLDSFYTYSAMTFNNLLTNFFPFSIFQAKANTEYELKSVQNKFEKVTLEYKVWLVFLIMLFLHQLYKLCNIPFYHSIVAYTQLTAA